MASPRTRLIKNLPKQSLETFYSERHAQVAESIDWTADIREVRKSLLKATTSLVGQPLAKLRSDSGRIDALTDELAQKILKHLIHDTELDEYYALTNEHDRSCWLFLTDETRFERAEDLWYVDTNRQSRIWDAFEGPKEASLDTSEEQLSAFRDKLLSLFRAAGKVKIDIYDRMYTDDDNDIVVTQIMVYQEDLPSTQLAFEADDLVKRVFRPVIEFALTYEPKTGHIEVIAAGKEQRRKIAINFAETVLQSPIKGEGIPLRRYKIQQLLKPKVLSYDPLDNIDSAKVTMLKVAPIDSNNSVVLNVARSEDREIYQVASQYFGENDPLKSGFVLKKVRITIKFKPDQENRQGKLLHVDLQEPNGCTLKDKTEKERLIGDKYLMEWGLVDVS